MKSVIQRVTRANVKVDGKIKGQINEGLLILLGVEPDDNETEVDLLANKIANLRIFCDENDKMNLSLLDINGEALVISNFTLCGDCRKGRRPFFGDAAAPNIAEPLYNNFCQKLSSCGISKVEKGIFGADMKVELLNNGPVTITINSKELPHR